MDLLNEFKQRIDDHDIWEKEIELKRGDFLCRSGQLNNNIYMVEEGSLRIFLMEDHEELTIRFGYQGDLFSALDSYISDQPTEYYIQCLKKCRLKIVSKSAFEDFVFGNKEINQMWIKLLHGLVYDQMERERDILTSSPAERFERVRKRSPRLFQEIPHKYIASYLRMTPETLSRIIKKS